MWSLSEFNDMFENTGPGLTKDILSHGHHHTVCYGCKLMYIIGGKNNKPGSLYSKYYKGFLFVGLVCFFVWLAGWLVG